MSFQVGISRQHGTPYERFIYDSEAFHVTLNSEFETVLDVEGKGRASIFSSTIVGSSEQKIKITVDEKVVFNDRSVGMMNHIGIFDFKLSLKIEHRSTGGDNVLLVVSYKVK